MRRFSLVFPREACMAEAVAAVSTLPRGNGLNALVRALRFLWRRLPVPFRTRFAWLVQPTAVFTGLKVLFERLPRRHQTRIYEMLQPRGLHHFFNYLANYRWIHRREHFAASLLPLQEEYWRADEHTRGELSHRFVHIVEGLVFKNGVKKTTSFARQSAILSRVLPTLTLNRDRIKVLDLPSSIGVASLATYDLLSARWPITSYVLGDLFFEIIYDEKRDCIFDDSGNLLQLGRWNGFFSVYRPGFSTRRFRALPALILWPLHLRSWFARQTYRFIPSDPGISILLVHPEVERRINEGVFQLRRTDILSAIEGQYDLILSFNLLVTRYFPSDLIAIGRANLSKALSEGGTLIIGDDDTYSVFQKIDGQLVLMKSEEKSDLEL
jgi:hypothetical protein